MNGRHPRWLRRRGTSERQANFTPVSRSICASYRQPPEHRKSQNAREERVRRTFSFAIAKPTPPRNKNKAHASRRKIPQQFRRHGTFTKKNLRLVVALLVRNIPRQMVGVDHDGRKQNREGAVTKSASESNYVGCSAQGKRRAHVSKQSDIITFVNASTNAR